MAAVRLQARLRGMLARRRAAWLANAISAVLAISAVWRGARARREARRQRGAAARINNWFRSLRGRANLERALHLARMAQIERLLREAEEQRRRLDEKARRAEEAADAFARVAFALRLQAMIRGRWGRKIFARRANAMLRLQIAIRARLGRKRFRRRMAAATVLQKLARGAFARLVCSELRAWLRLEHAAAVAMHRRWRGMLGRRTAALRRTARTRWEGAASMLGKQARLRALRRRMVQVCVAAFHISRIGRGFLGRRELKRRVAAEAERWRQAAEAAEMLRIAQLAANEQSRLLALRAQAEKEAAKRFAAAATRIQAADRGWYGRVLADALRKELRFGAVRQEAAARLLQLQAVCVRCGGVSGGLRARRRQPKALARRARPAACPSAARVCRRSRGASRDDPTAGGDEDRGRVPRSPRAPRRGEDAGGECGGTRDGGGARR